ncbi:MAG: pyridoxal phosphate-dependent aminotransferase [Saprospiraceae bacterium]|nr:pyridoxal phosphate-dependent aminotransferase [Saprospiraceae bacterium]
MCAQLSSRAHLLPESPFRQLLPYAEAAKKKGVDVIHLNIGQPDIPAPATALEAIHEAYFDKLPYSHALGIESLREGFAGYYSQTSPEVKPADVVITNGSSEGLYFVLFSLLEPKDEVLVFEPYYANYSGFAIMADVTLKAVSLHVENNFDLPDNDTIEKSITPRTRAILFTNPCNPTGRVYSYQELKRLGELAIKYDLLFIVDEVYRVFSFAKPCPSILDIPELRDRAIVIDSISKRYSACGARVGTIVCCNPQLLTGIDRLCKLRLSAPFVGQLFAQAALDDSTDYMEKVKKAYQRRRDLVYDRLRHIPGVETYLPEGAFYGFVKLPVENAFHFCQWLLESFSHHGQTVMMAHGAAFYLTPGMGRNEVRLAYVASEERLQQAMDCIEVALQHYPHSTLVKELVHNTNQ